MISTIIKCDRCGAAKDVDKALGWARLALFDQQTGVDKEPRKQVHLCPKCQHELTIWMKAGRQEVSDRVKVMIMEKKEEKEPEETGQKSGETGIREAREEPGMDLRKDPGFLKLCDEIQESMEAKKKKGRDGAGKAGEKPAKGRARNRNYDKEELKRLIRDESMSMKEIAEIMNVSYSTECKAAKKLRDSQGE